MGVSPALLVSAAVEALKRRGFIDRDFFDNLQLARPKRVAEIRTVRGQWLHNARLDRGELWAEGRYELDSACGQGGFGLVWKAIDTRTGSFVALKILLEQHSDDRRVRQRFFRGAAVLAGLSHPAIVGVRSGVEQEGLRFFYVMDFVEGSSLDALVSQRPPSELLKYVLQIGHALSYLHARDLLHRDIKPSNILVNAKRQAILIDFDLVTGDAFAPMTTRALGTAIYAPPEANASDTKTAAYDVFSLARTVEYVIRGREPRVEELAAFDSPAPLGTETVKSVLRAALRANPAERTQSVERFCADLCIALELPLPIKQTTSHELTTSTRGPSKPIRGSTFPVRSVVVAEPRKGSPSSPKLPIVPAPTDDRGICSPVRVTDRNRDVWAGMSRWLRPFAGIVAGFLAATFSAVLWCTPSHSPDEPPRVLPAPVAESTPVLEQLSQSPILETVEPSQCIETAPTALAGVAPIYVAVVPAEEFLMGGSNAEPNRGKDDHQTRVSTVRRVNPPRTTAPTVSLAEPSTVPAAKHRNATLKISAGPGRPLATVSIDGVDQLKATPFDVMVSAGNHTVVWKYIDGTTFTKDIMVFEHQLQIVKGGKK